MKEKYPGLTLIEVLGQWALVRETGRQLSERSGKGRVVMLSRVRKKWGVNI